jgi:hypothetical protein
MATVVADAYARLLVDDSQFEQQVVGAAQKAGDKAGPTLGQRLSAGIKKTLTVGGAIGGAFFAGAIESAATFEDQLRTINTITRLSDEDLRKLGEGIKEVARETGKSTEDLAQGAYDLASAGVDASKIIDVLRDSAKLSVGALSSTGEAVDLVTSVLNAYKLDASESARVTDVFAKAVERGKVTAAELGATIATVAPIAANMGIEIEEVAAGYAALTKRGTPAAQAAIQMSGAMRALLSPTQALNRLQAATGKNFAQIAREKGLQQAYIELRQATDEAGKAFAKAQAELLKTKNAAEAEKVLKKYQKTLGLTSLEVKQFAKRLGKEGAAEGLNFLRNELVAGDQGLKVALGTVEAFQFALAATGENAQGFAEDLQAEFDSAGTTIGQFDERMKSPAQQANKFAEEIKTRIMDIGQAGMALGPLLLTLNNLGPALGMIISPARIVGGLIGSLPGLLISGLGSIVPAIAGGIASLGSTIGGLLAAAIPAGMALLPILLIGALIAAIALLIVNEDLRNQVFAVGGQIIQTLMDALAGLAGAIGTIVPQVVDTLLSIPGKVVGLIADLFGLGDKSGKSMLDAIKGVLPQIVSTVLNLPGSIAGGLISGFGDLANKAAKAFLDGIAGLPAKAGEIIGGIGDFVGGFIPKFQTGAWEVPRTGPAIVHAGEMIVPARVAEQIRSGAAVLGGGEHRTTNVSVVVNNPLPEPASTSIAREMRKLSYLGVVS